MLIGSHAVHTRDTDAYGIPELFAANAFLDNSPDGWYVAFASQSLDMIPGTSSSEGVYVKDLPRGSIVLASSDGAGSPLALGFETLGAPRISGHGSTVAFTTSTKPIAAKDTNHTFDVFLTALVVADRLANRASIDRSRHIERASFEADGVTIVFTAVDIFPPIADMASHDGIIACFDANAQMGYENDIITDRNGMQTVTFDGLAYLASHPDPMAGLGDHFELATSHPIQSGFHDGRTDRA